MYSVLQRFPLKPRFLNQLRLYSSSWHNKKGIIYVHVCRLPFCTLQYSTLEYPNKCPYIHTFLQLTCMYKNQLRLFYRKPKTAYGVCTPEYMDIKSSTGLVSHIYNNQFQVTAISQFNQFNQSCWFPRIDSSFSSFSSCALPIPVTVLHLWPPSRPKSFISPPPFSTWPQNKRSLRGDTGITSHG